MDENALLKYIAEKMFFVFLLPMAWWAVKEILAKLKDLTREVIEMKLEFKEMNGKHNLIQDNLRDLKERVDNHALRIREMEGKIK